jgi:hypothetical protein
LGDEDDAAEKTYSGRIRVFPGETRVLTYRLPLVGLGKLKVQLNHGPQKRTEQVEKYKGRRGIQ